MTPTATATRTATTTPTVTLTPTPTATPTAVPGGILSISPAKIKFGSVGDQTGTAIRSLTVKNIGKGSLGVFVHTSLGPPFSITAGAGAFALAPGAANKVSLGFTPLTPGPTSQNLTITSSDPRHPSVDVPVTGAGVSGTLKITGRLKFAATEVGNTATHKLRIKNTGLGVLHVAVDTLTNPFAVASGGGSFALNHNQTQHVTVTFTPDTTGSAPGETLKITSDDPAHALVNVAVSGAGK